MENLKVSVIIPIYNVEEYLAECLESVINQTYQNMEIICIEDKSTDNSLDILNQYAKKDTRIRLYCNRENRGLAYSRNIGLDAAEGDYILFVDSDDYIQADLIAVCMEKSADNDLICFDYTLFDNIHGPMKSHTYLIKDGEYRGENYFVEAVKNNSVIFSAWSKLYKRAFLDKHRIRFCDGLLYEDILFSFSCFLKASRIYSLHNRFYWYRIRKDSIMMKKVSAQNLESYFFVICEMAWDYVNNNYKEELCDAIQGYIRKASRDFIQAYRKSDEKAAKAQFLKNKNIKYLKLYDTFAELCVKSGLLEDISVEHLEYIKSFRYVILYGAGDIGRSILEILDFYDIPIYGIAVTMAWGNKKSLMGNRIRQIEEYRGINKEECLVIIAVTEKYYMDVFKKVQDCGFTKCLKVQDW